MPVERQEEEPPFLESDEESSAEETPEADQQQQQVRQEQTQDAAAFVAEMTAKNDISNLLSSYFTRDSQVLTLDWNNPHKQLVVLPPKTKSLESFLVEAKKNRWIESILHREHYMEGMLTYDLAKEDPALYILVADNNRLDLVKVVPAILTLSMASYLGLNDTLTSILASK